jgi:hypothetical protein
MQRRAEFAPKTIPLPHLSHPHLIEVDGDQIFVTDGVEATTIYVYSLQGELQARFGRTGDAPEAFIVSPGHTVRLDIQPEYLLVSSQERVSFFSREGAFLRSLPTAPSSTHYRALGKGFVGQGYLKVDATSYYTVNLYDADFEPVREICRVENQYQPHAGNRVLTRLLRFRAFGDELFVTGSTEDFAIDVYDSEGKSLRTIQQAYSRLGFLDEHKEQIHTFYRTHPNFRRIYEVIKDEFVFPALLPAIREFRVADGRIYVLTYKQTGGSSEFYVLDVEGKLLRRAFLPLAQPDVLAYCPFATSAGNLYQLERNRDNDGWELRVTDLW